MKNVLCTNACGECTELREGFQRGQLALRGQMALRGRFHREGPLDEGLRLFNNKVPTTKFQQRSSNNVVH